MPKTRQEVIDRFANSGWARTTDEYVNFVEGLIAATVPEMIADRIRLAGLDGPPLAQVCTRDHRCFVDGPCNGYPKPEPAKAAEGAPERVTLQWDGERLWNDGIREDDKSVEYVLADAAGDRDIARFHEIRRQEERAEKAEADARINRDWAREMDALANTVLPALRERAEKAEAEVTELTKNFVRQQQEYEEAKLISMRRGAHPEWDDARSYVLREQFETMASRAEKAEARLPEVQAWNAAADRLEKLERVYAAAMRVHVDGGIRTTRDAWDELYDALEAAK